jgi:hypothetical protein
MPKKLYKLTRATEFRPQIPIILIATEGKETEPQYFNIFKNRKNINVRILPTKKGKSSPIHVRKRMMKEIKDKGIGEHDYAWLVIDRDKWEEEHLNQAYSWSISKNNYGLAISNPKFEYWLLLHFENGNDIGTSKECHERLKQYIPEYEKNNIDQDLFSIERIEYAIRNAKIRNNPGEKWPLIVGTTVYKLVEILLT